MFFKKRFLNFFILSILTTYVPAQSAYQHISHKDLYQFLDELASLHIINTHTAIKPYDRHTIAEFLEEAHLQRSQLSFSQRDRLEHYMSEFVLELEGLPDALLRIAGTDSISSFHLLPPEYIYKDSSFRMLLRPVYGIRSFSGGQDSFWVSFGGAEVVSYVGDNWSIYASLRDNYQPGHRLAQPQYLTQEPGGVYKGLSTGGPGGEFSEMRGGLVWSWNWGSLGFVKDHIQWGDHLNGSNIFSGRTPSFPMIKLNMSPVSWLDFNYYHGWLVSESIDSIRSIFREEGANRLLKRQMYIAANAYTLKPFERLHLTVGNSIVYGDMEVQPAYLIPFLFYKSVVHTLHWGASLQNNAMYFNVSSRQIKHLHLYATYFIDEFSIKRVTDPTRYNFTSYKLGMSLTDWPLRNVYIGAEYTFSNPITFLHDEATTAFQSNRYNLGHYLTDNAEEYFATVRVYPVNTLRLSATYVHARKGNYYEYIRGRRDPRIDELPVLDDIVWENSTLSLEARLKPVRNLRVFAIYSISSIIGRDADGRTGQDHLDMFSPKYLHGKNNILELGFNYGF